MNKNKKEETKQAIKHALYNIGDAVETLNEVIEDRVYANKLHSKIAEIARELKIKL